MRTHEDASGVNREDNGRYAERRYPEQLAGASFGKYGGTATVGSAEAIDQLDEAMNHLVQVEMQLGQARTESSGVSHQGVASLRVSREQAEFEANAACSFAGAAIYGEVGKAGAEDILCSLQFHLPVDASGAAAIAYAAMDDEEFALEVFARAGSRFVGFLDNHSLTMILDHESEEVRVAAVLAGAAQKKGLTTKYIGRYPAQAIVDAANTRQELTGKSDRFTLTDTHLVSESEQAGSASDRLTTLADSYNWGMLPPQLRSAA